MTTAKKPTSIDRLRAAANRDSHGNDAVDAMAATVHYQKAATGRHHHAESNIKDEPKKPVDTRPPLADRLKAMLKAKKPKRTKVELSILPQRRPWESQDGRVTMICDLDDEHLVNCLFLLKRRAIAKRLALMDQKYNTNRTVAKHWALGMGYTVGSGNTSPSAAGTALHEAIEKGEDPYAAVAKALKASISSQPDYTVNTTWEDFTEVAFHACRLEALRRGLDDAITLLMTNRLRLKD